MLGQVVKDSLKAVFARKAASSEPRVATVQHSDGVPVGSSADEFVLGLLYQLYSNIHQIAPDNYDHLRFSSDGIDRSDHFDAAEAAFNLKFTIDHADQFLAAQNILADDESANLYTRLILYRLLGHRHFKIRADHGWQRDLDALEWAKKFAKSPSVLDVGGFLGQIQHHEGIPTDDGTIMLDCWSANVLYTAWKRQYYFDRNSVRICPAPGNVVIDAGGCFGDTAIYFAKSVGPAGHVYSFDPLPQHGKVIQHNICQNMVEKTVTYVPYAVGESANGLSPDASAAAHSNEAAPGFSMLHTRAEFPVTSIDDFCESNALHRLDFVKMDIEGFELKALKGAQRSIKQFQPALAISLYHKPEDLFEIPLWIKSTFPNYSLYLDHFTIHREETVLYAIPTE